MNTRTNDVSLNFKPNQSFINSSVLFSILLRNEQNIIFKFHKTKQKQITTSLCSTYKMYHLGTATETNSN